ncbi:hypothetical protein BH10ACT2_BH10ACT2_21560 [soil metagenome]
MKISANSNVTTQVVSLCLVGALATFSSCSTTTAAQSNDSQARTVATTVPKTTSPVTTLARASNPPETTVPKTTLPPTTTTPETTLPPTTTLPANVQIVGPWLGVIVPVGKSDGPDTAEAQLRLDQLGFWSGANDGDYGFAMTQAVMAFQKYLGLEASGKLDEDTAAWLSAFPERAHGASDDGTLVEVDKTKQLLFLIVDGKTTWTFNTSTGSGISYVAHNQNTGEVEKGDAVTPNGVWKTNRERPNGWWQGDLGDIYRPKYFRGGVAIHGMTRVPNTPVSHGCVRLSTAAMDFIWDNNLIPLGTPVWVHE